MLPKCLQQHCRPESPHDAFALPAARGSSRHGTKIGPIGGPGNLNGQRGVLMLKFLGTTMGIIFLIGLLVVIGLIALIL